MYLFRQVSVRLAMPTSVSLFILWKCTSQSVRIYLFLFSTCLRTHRCVLLSVCLFYLSSPCFFFVCFLVIIADFVVPVVSYHLWLYFLKNSKDASIKLKSRAKGEGSREEDNDGGGGGGWGVGGVKGNSGKEVKWKGSRWIGRTKKKRKRGKSKSVKNGEKKRATGNSD